MSNTEAQPDDAHPLYQLGWKAGYKHGAWQSQHAQPAASGGPVPLTDAQIKAVLLNVMDSGAVSWLEICRAIEAAHGIAAPDAHQSNNQR